MAELQSQGVRFGFGTYVTRKLVLLLQCCYGTPRFGIPPRTPVLGSHLGCRPGSLVGALWALLNGSGVLPSEVVGEAASLGLLVSVALDNLGTILLLVEVVDNDVAGDP